jgi:hypothetical protein
MVVAVTTDPDIFAVTHALHVQPVKASGTAALSVAHCAALGLLVESCTLAAILALVTALQGLLRA